jgi:hypothetical protein
MKTFQKITLAAAISAAPFMSQAMEALDDSVLAATTGQAGVTIEIDLGDQGIKIGSVVYTDTVGLEDDGAGTMVSDEDGGVVRMENLHIGLEGTLVQTIDVTETGDLEMTMSAPGVMSISMGNNVAAVNDVNGSEILAADVTGEFSALALEATDGSQSEIINNLSLNVELGESTTTIKNLGTSNALSLGMGTLGTNVVGADYQAMSSSMIIEMNAKAKVTDMNVGLFGYTNDQAVLRSAGAASDYAAGNTNAVLLGYTDAADFRDQNEYISQYDTNNDGSLSATELTELQNDIATGSAIQVSGVSITDANSSDGMFSVEQKIWAIGGDATLSGSDAGVYIQMGAMNLDINVAGIGIGGNSIGSVAINGLELAGMTQRIYGH